MSEPNGSICKYHYDHHTRLETLKSDVDKAEKKIEDINENYIKTTAEFIAEIKNLREEQKNLREYIQHKALRLKYVAMTICGLASFIVVGIVELIKIIFK